MNLLDALSVRIFAVYAAIMRMDARLSSKIKCLSKWHRVAYAILKGIFVLAIDDMLKG